MRSFVLALLCLRALIPAGFMLAPVDGHLEFALCDSGTTAALHRADMQGMQGMEMPASSDAEHGAPDHVHADPTCPYAQSAGPAPLPAVLAVSTFEFIRPALFERPVEQPRPVFGPIRAQSPRAPPALA